MMRQRCNLVVLVAAFAMILAGAGEAATVGYWKFEEASGAAIDSGTGGNNGALLGGAARSSSVFGSTPATEPNAKSMEFSGVDGDAVNMGTSPDVGTGDFTLECWVYVRTDGADSFPLLAGKMIGGHFGDKGFELMARPDGSEGGEAGLGKWQARFAIRFGGPQDGVYSSDLDFNRWYHLAGVRQGTGATAVKLYVDGFLAGEASTAITDLTSLQKFSVGGADVDGAGGFGRALDGFVDEVRLSDTALTRAQFLNVPNPATISYYRFEEASGDAIDIGTGGYNGSLLGGAARSSFVFGSTPATEPNTQSMEFFGNNGDAVNPGINPEVDDIDFTLEAWTYIRTDGADSFPLLAGKLISGNFLDRGFELMARPDGSEGGEAGTGKWQARFAIRFGGSQDQVLSDDLDFNTWYHLAGIREGTGAGAVKLYIDGKLAGEASTAHTSLTSGQQFSIGGADVGGGGGFQRALDGFIDEVRLSDGALPPDQFLNVPQPGTLGLMVGALLLFGFYRRRR